jgi:Restriction endonuclease
MARLPQIRGALLEEIVLRLLQQAGYRLVKVGEEGTSPGPSGLEVQGRGAPHQIDALVTPIYAHSFIHTIRLIVEAKCESKTVGVHIVRNLVGTLLDLNQNFITWNVGADKLNMQRFNYHGALFATNGYSKRAEQYALAHQIFLIDYSNVSLLKPVIDALLSLNLSDFGIEENSEAEFSIATLRDEFGRAIRANGDIAPGEVFARTGLEKIRERLVL